MIKTFMYWLVVLIGLGLLVSVASAQDLSIGNYSLITQQRLDRFTFEYTYRAQVTNAGAAVRNMVATLTATPPGVTVQEGTLSFGDVAAGATLTSSDTFVVRHDRRFAFRGTDLLWSITFDPVAPPNTPPLADAGADQTVPVNTSVQLDGTGSSDPDQDPLTFRWSLTAPGDSAATLSDPASAMPSFTADVVGSYVAQLIVNDGTVDSAAATVRITVSETANHAPLFSSTPERTAIRAGQTYRYQVMAGDWERDPLTFELSTAPAGMTLSSDQVLSWTASTEGSFPVVVTVTDTKGARATQSFTLRVLSAELPSSAVIGPGGGAVGLADGATIEVPPGALSSGATISIREVALPANATFDIPTSIVISKVYSLEPSGLEFNKLVRITIPYNESQIPAGNSEDSLALEVQSGDGIFYPAADEAPPETGLSDIIESPYQEIDTFRNEVTVYRRGFSIYVVTIADIRALFGTASGREVTEECTQPKRPFMQVLRSSTAQFRGIRACRLPAVSVDGSSIAVFDTPDDRGSEGYLRFFNTRTGKTSASVPIPLDTQIALDAQKLSIRLKQIEEANQALAKQGFTPMLKVNVTGTSTWNEQKQHSLQSIEANYLGAGKLSIVNRERKRTLWIGSLSKLTIQCGGPESRWRDYPNMIEMWADKSFQKFAIWAKLMGAQDRCTDPEHWQVITLKQSP